MAKSNPTSGYDAWVREDKPNTRHPSSAAIQLRHGAGVEHLGFLWMPLPDLIAGQTIIAAPLTITAYAALSPVSFIFQAVTKKWDASTVTFNNQPGVVGPTATIVVGALAPGQTAVVDLAALLQPVADGTRKNYGWRITTSGVALQKLASFDSPGISWALDIEYTDQPEIPTDQHPNGTVVGLPKPTVSVDFTDFGHDDAELSAIQVQVDLNGDGTPDWDSGQLAATAPVLDLLAAGMTGTITSGQTVKWRARVWDENGQPSPDFSAWATYTYVPLQGLVLDSPASGLMYDPTTDVLAHITGTTDLEAYRVRILAPDQTTLYFDSRKQAADDDADITYGLPLRNDDGALIFHDDTDSVLHLRTWDDQDREAVPGAPAYAELWQAIHFDDDIALDPVPSYQVSQVDDTPFVKHTWTDLEAADAYVISRDGVQTQRLEAADVVAGVSAYGFVDVEAEPYVRHTYELRRVTTGVGRSEPARAALLIECPGVWLLRDNGDFAVLLGDPPESASLKDRRSTYQPVNVPHDVDLITGMEGLSDDGFSHWIEDYYPMPGGLSVAETKKVLAAIKRNPADSVRLIFAGFSKPVRLRNLSVRPHTNFVRRTQAHAVTFGVTQVGEFDFTVG